MDSSPRATWIPASQNHAVLHRQQEHLQRRLQILLDAQSEGLLAGLTGVIRQTEEGSSTGTVTPTSTVYDTPHRPNSEHVVPVRQPKARHVGLRRARREISRAIEELALLKYDEMRLLEDAAARREIILSTIHDFSQKEAGLRMQIQEIGGEDATAALDDMRREEHELGREIHEIETRLYEMKAKHRMLTRQIGETDNRVQAKLSSYQNSLELALRQTTLFLANPPSELDEDIGRSKRRDGIWSLPRDRRTLAIAEEYYKAEEEHLHTQRIRAEKEGEALEQGREIWDEVVHEVAAVEETLRAEMEKLKDEHLTKRSHRETRRESGMQHVLERMGSAQKELDERLTLAEENDWKLLVCCIGAEAQALSEGHDVLQAVSSKSSGRSQTWVERPSGVDQTEEHGSDFGGHDGDGPDGAPNDHRAALNQEDESGEEGPGPDLLISPSDET